MKTKAFISALLASSLLAAPARAQSIGDFGPKWIPMIKVATLSTCIKQEFPEHAGLLSLASSLEKHMRENDITTSEGTSFYETYKKGWFSRHVEIFSNKNCLNYVAYFMRDARGAR